MGNLGWVLPPEQSRTIMRCIAEPTDLSGLVGQTSISSGSLQIPVDNAGVGFDDSAWACMTSCFASNPTSQLGDGLAQIEIRAEELRHVVCATSDLLQDAAFPIESWIMEKVSTGFRNLISAAILGGDGAGKPEGLLNRRSGIPVVEVSATTPAGQFTWMDLIGLAFEVPLQWHENAAFYMNQRTLGMCLSMSDAMGRPICLPVPITDRERISARFTIAGFPIIVVSQMPNVAPGSEPVLFGDLRATYLLVVRRGVGPVQRGVLPPLQVFSESWRRGRVPRRVKSAQNPMMGED
jgi:HK97 family phage major capsid protein